MKSTAASKQKMLKRLKMFCGMLGDDLKTIDGQLLGRIEDIIRRLGTPPKVAIAGMGQTNHRNLAEFFLGADLFSELDDPSQCPVIQVRHSDVPMTRAIYGEKRQSLEGLAVPQALATGKPDAIGLEMANPIASQIGFTILPDYNGDDNRARYLVNLLQNTEVLVWCSESTQPWSSQERSLWSTVPDQLKARSLLALTGAEGLDSADTQQIFDEKCDLVSDDVHSMVAISIREARDAAPNGHVIDAETFASSGGQDLLQSLMALVQISQVGLLAQGKQLMSELDKIPLGSAQPVPELPVTPLPAAAKAEAAPAGPPSRDAIRTFLSARAAACTAALDTCGKKDGFSDLFDEIVGLLSGLSDFVEAGLELETDHGLMVAQLDEAKELVGLLTYEDNETAAQEAADIARQISADVWIRTFPRIANDDTPNLTEYEQGSASG